MSNVLKISIKFQENLKENITKSWKNSGGNFLKSWKIWEEIFLKVEKIQEEIKKNNFRDFAWSLKTFLENI